MVENLSKERAVATLGVSGYRGKAAALRLTGPSPLATGGARIQGAEAAADGTVTPGRAATLQCTSHGCPLTLAPYSAAQITLG